MRSVSREKLPLRDLAVIAAVAFAVIAPSFFLGQASGHDFEFHLASWMDVARQWRLGVIFPRWAVLANHGYGEPRFLFYPPISWCLGAALGMVLPWKVVPGAYIFISLVLAGVSMHRLARERISPNGVLTAACLYILNPYCLLTVYLRSDFAELLGAALFPLAVHYTLNCFPGGGLRPGRAPDGRPADGGPPDGRSPDGVTGGSSKFGFKWGSEWRNVAALASVYAAIWLTNPPAAVITSYALAALFLAICLFARSQPLAMGAAGLALAMALGLGLTGFYLVPAAFEQKWVNIAEAISGGLHYDQSFLFSSTLDPEHDLFNLEASATAVLMIALAGIGAVISHRRLAGATNLSDTDGDGATLSPEAALSGPASRATARAQANLLWTLMFTLAVASTALMFPISSLVWRYAPKLGFVQFPWRWLFVLGVSLAYFLGDAFAGDRRTTPVPGAPGLRRGSKIVGWLPKRFAVRSVAAGIVAMVLVGSGAAMAADAWWDPDDAPAMQAAIESGQGYDGVDEYCARGGDCYDLPPNASMLTLLPSNAHEVAREGTAPAGASTRIESWQPEHRVFDVDAPQPVIVAPRLLEYPAWQVRVNGRMASAGCDPDSAQMTIALPAGHSHVEVDFTRTPDRSAGAGLSMAAVVVFGGLLWAGKKREEQEV